MGVFDKRLNVKPYEYPTALKFVDAINNSYWLHCVGPDDRVSTNKGLIKVIDLFNSDQELFLNNGERIVNSSKMLKTGERLLYTLNTVEGYTHTVTEDHRIMTPDGWREAKDLKTGDFICVQEKEGVFGSMHKPDLAYLLGHYQGDGSNKKDSIFLSVWEHEYHLIPSIEEKIKSVYSELGITRKPPVFGIPQYFEGSDVSYRRLGSNFLKREGFVKNVIPEYVWQGDKSTVCAYLKGLFTTDGTISQTKKHQSIKIFQANCKFVKDLQLLLLHLGVRSRLFYRPAGKSVLPDGKGGQKEYNVKEGYTLEVTRHKSVKILNDATNLFEFKNKTLREVNDKKSHPIKHVRFSSLDLLSKQDVYCVNIKDDNKAWLCNGFITHNTEWSFESDAQDFKVGFNEVERSAVKNAIMAISQIEVSVKTFWAKLYDVLPKPEFGDVGYSFAESEVRHGRAYSHLLEVMGLNREFETLHTIPAIQGRIDYLTKYLSNAGDNSKERYALTLALFSSFIEGVSLFSQFLIIKSFSQHKNQLKDIDNVIQATAKEEELHLLFGTYVLQEIKKEYPEWFNSDFKIKIERACKKAFQAEIGIVDWIFEKGELDFLSKVEIVEFIKYRFNYCMNLIDIEPIFEIDANLLKKVDWFLTELTVQVQPDFFYKKSTNYSKNMQSITESDLF